MRLGIFPWLVQRCMVRAKSSQDGPFYLTTFLEDPRMGQLLLHTPMRPKVLPWMSLTCLRDAQRDFGEQAVQGTMALQAISLPSFARLSRLWNTASLRKAHQQRKLSESHLQSNVPSTRATPRIITTTLSHPSSLLTFHRVNNMRAGKSEVSICEKVMLLFSLGCLKPSSPRKQNLPQSLFNRFAEGRTIPEIRDIGNISFIYFTIENVDVVMLHGSSLPSDAPGEKG